MLKEKLLSSLDVWFKERIDDMVNVTVSAIRYHYSA